jgi:hypothetical protein
MNLATPKAAVKLELLFDKLAYVVSLLYVYECLCSYCSLFNIIMQEN